MKRSIVYVIFGVLSFCLRLFFESQSKIITGINGGYYPVQVRSIIEDGHLAMNDMPLVFYINAYLAKLAIYIFSNFSSEFLILQTVKVLGALSIPLILIPLYRIIHNYLSYEIPKSLEYALIAFCMFSFSSLYLSAEMLKNAYGLVGFTYLLYYTLLFFDHRSLKYAIYMALSLLVIGMTHFGVFAISIIFLVLFLISVYNKKAIVPIISLVVIGFLMVFFFDHFRALNAVNIVEKWFGKPWRIVFYPTGIASLFISGFLILILFLLNRNKKVDTRQKQLFTVFLGFIIMLSLPFLRFELWRRFNLMVFIPQVVAILLAYPYLKTFFKRRVPQVLVLICCLSVGYSVLLPKQNSISDAAYEDLSNMSTQIENPDRAITFVRHGLDWWVSWQLRTKIAQPQIELDKAMSEQYDDILIIRQHKGRYDLYPGPGSPFESPSVPKNSKVLYNSEFYNLYQWIK